jgi:hypothetical protein
MSLTRGSLIALFVADASQLLQKEMDEGVISPMKVCRNIKYFTCG